MLWTRLALDPLADDGLGGMPERRRVVEWEVARDERMRRVVRRGTAIAGGASAHTVKVDVRGLRSGSTYFFRFRHGRHLSPVGRTRTLPAARSRPEALTLVTASCAHFESGWFTAYRRLAEEEPDLVVHLGDYLYEYAPFEVPVASGEVRTHAGPETVTLADYRRRHAQYRTDPDLQFAHATAPWLISFDDHEVAGNRAGDHGADGRRASRGVATRRHAGLGRTRPDAVRATANLVAYRRLRWGDLAAVHLLDTRSYRTDQACGDGRAICPASEARDRTMLGGAQEKWLERGLTAGARWDLVAQQALFARCVQPGGELSMDAWDGYPAARARVVRAMRSAANPVVFTGDIHHHLAADVHADPLDPGSPVVTSELATTSLSSGGDGGDFPDGAHVHAAINPHLGYAADRRGYVRTRITRDSLTADFRCLPFVSRPGAPAATGKSYRIEAGVRGLR